MASFRLPCFFIIISKCLLDTLSKHIFYLIKDFTKNRVENTVIHHCYQVSIHNYKLSSILYKKLSEDSVKFIPVLLHIILHIVFPTEI